MDWTDSLFPWNRVPVDHIISPPGLSGEDRIATLADTAAKLLDINSCAGCMHRARF